MKVNIVLRDAVDIFFLLWHQNDIIYSAKAELFLIPHCMFSCKMMAEIPAFLAVLEGRSLFLEGTRHKVIISNDSESRQVPPCAFKVL